MRSFEQVVTNLATPIPGREIRQGREFIVVPMTMIVPGVLNGSQGPLLYPPEEVAKNPEDWNTIPVTLGHPSKDGKPLSARSTDPAVRRIGTVENSSVDPASSLRAEAWIDVMLANRADSRLVPAILRRDKVEISTGLYTDNESVNATHNGVPYEAIARNYKPDHLAVLMDQKGACSTADGCGLNVNRTDNHPGDHDESVHDPTGGGGGGGNVKDTVSKMGRADGDDPEWDNAASEADTRAVTEVTSGVSDAEVTRISGDSVNQPRVEAISSSSFKDIKGELQSKGYRQMQSKGDAPDRVFRKEGSTHQLSVSTIQTSGGGQTGTQMLYTPTYSDIQLNWRRKTMDDKQRKAIMDLLVNSCCWEEGDRVVLNSMPDEHLTRLKLKMEEDEATTLALNTAVKVLGVDPKLTLNEMPDAFKAKGKQDTKSPPEAAAEEEEEEGMEKNKKAPTGNETPKWEDIAPSEVLEDLTFARNAKKAEKDAIIGRLTANVADAAKPTQIAVYNEMKLEQLQAIDPGVPEPVQPEPGQLVDYTGNAAGLGVTPVVSAKVPDNLKPMSTPTINYDDLSEITEGGRRKS
jgi:hypothetical protein